MSARRSMTAAAAVFRTFRSRKVLVLLSLGALLVLAASFAFATLARAQEADGFQSVKVNFQPDTAPVPAGYTKDIGTAYSDARGHGWVREDSLGEGVERVPLDVSPNTRDRDRNKDQRLDTLMHMQFPTTSTTAVRTPAAWEYTLPNGAYLVTVAVGEAFAGNDPESHRINVEGVTAISGFANLPNSGVTVNGADARHRTATARVEVADGGLTVDARGGTNTKINYIDIAKAPDAGAVDLKVNFQSEAAAVPGGYVRDFGEAFGGRGASGLSYGWVVPGTNDPLSLAGNGRDRNRTTLPALTDQRLDTLMHVQGNDLSSFTGVRQTGAWEISVPDGRYRVEVSVGDQKGTASAACADPCYDSRHSINVEGVEAIKTFQATLQKEYEQAVVETTVTDGKLTVDAAGGFNTKINHVDVLRTGDATPPADTTPPDAPTVDLADGSDTGRSKTDDLTNDTTPTFSGAAEAGSTVRLYDGDALLGETTTDGSGYAFTVSADAPLGDGEYKITATATDAANNASARSTALPVVVDRGEPTVTITGGPEDGGTIAESSVEFAFSSEEGAAFECGLDGTFEDCASPKGYNGLENGGHTFAARAADAAGNVGTAGRRFVVDTPAPDSPRISSPDSGDYDTDGTIVVSGTAEAGATVELFEGTASRGTSPVAEDGGWSIELVSVNEGAHTYAARASRDGRTSGDSNALTVNVDTTRPRAPESLTATAGNAGVTLEWAAVSAADLAGYRVYRDGADEPVATVEGARTTHTDTGRTNGTRYSYEVSAVDEAGNESGRSAAATATPQVPRDSEAPSAPGNVAAVGGEREVKLNWTAATDNVGVAGYNVYEGETRLNGSTSVDGMSFTHTGLGDDEAHSYVVEAVDAEGNATRAGVVSATTLRAVECPGGACADKSVTLPFEAGFDGTGKGVHDKDREGTGFRLVQASSGGKYLPERLDVFDGRLRIAATDGIQYKTATKTTNGNTLDNALGARFDARDKTTRIAVDVINPPGGTNAAQQAGLWFGPSEDNYVKLIVTTAGSSSTTQNQHKVQLTRERNGVSAPNADLAVTDEVNLASTNNVWPDWRAKTVRLTLEIDSAGRATAFYALDGAAPVRLGELTVPAGWFTDASETGVFASRRNNTEAGEKVYTLDDFAMAEVADTTAPGSPAGLAAAAGDRKVTLDWSAGAEADLAGYDVYRSATGPADTSGTPLNGATLLARGPYEDTGLGNGTAYDYAVVAVDKSGNRSEAARTSATPKAVDPTPPTAFAARVNFQNAAAQVPQGYVRDFGEAFGARAGVNQGSGLSYGWVDPGTSTPLDLSVGGTTPGNGRDRAYSSGDAKVASPPLDQRLDTIMHMQANSIHSATRPFNGTPKEGAWEISVPDGIYEVTASVGDPLVDGTASDTPRHTIRVEGQTAIGEFQSSGASGSATRHKAATVVVPVSDGRLTVDATGGFNTKINHVDVASTEVGPDTTAPAAPENALARAGDGRVTVTWNENTEPDLAGYNVYAGERAEGTPLNGGTLIGNESYIHRNLENGVERVYTVEAVDKTGNKAAAQPVRATPQAGATEDRPRVTMAIPPDGATDVSLTGQISTQLSLVSEGVDDKTFSMQTVRVVKINADGTDGAQVTTTYGTSGGNDVINAVPTAKLEPNTQYRFEVTEGVKDLNGIPFVPFRSTFTTGSSSVFTPPGVSKLDLSGVTFERVAQSVPNKTYTSVAFGPDGRLYAGTVTGEIYRFDVAQDTGALSNATLIDTIRQSNSANDGMGDCNTSTQGANGCTKNRLIIGLSFEPGSTAEDPRLWVTHSTYGFRYVKDWGGKLSVLSGKDLAGYRDVLVNLPRSSKDHLTNSIAFNDGKIYIPVGATTAMGAYDASWQGTERLLSAAVIEVDYKAVSGSLDVKTLDGGGPHDPYAAGAPVRTYATGIRNAVDLVWHTNGHLYAPTNGSAGGSNVPATPSNYGDLPQCRARGYVGPAVPDFDGANNGEGSMKIPTTQLDYLFDVVRGGYYGNPNPSRCEWVLNLGDPTTKKAMSGAGVGEAPGEVDEYPDGTQADPNYRGWAYNFINNKSPNGAIEYKGGAFGGKLKGKLVVARYTTGDIIVLEPGANGDIARDNAEVPGFSRVSGSENPLDLIEDPKTGNIYVTEGVKNPPDGTGRITLLKAADTATRPPNAKLDKERVVANAVIGSARGSGYQLPVPKTVTVTNDGGSDLTVSNVAVVGGTASPFKLAAGPSGGSITLKPGESQTLGVTFDPTEAGVAGDRLRFDTNDPDTPSVEVRLRGLGTRGEGGANEPSLQWVFDAYELPIKTGDDNAATNVLHSANATSAAPLTGSDEVPNAQKMQAAYSDAPVTVEPLAVFGPQHSSGTVTKVGRYVPAGAEGAGTKTELFAAPNGAFQSLDPMGGRTFQFETPDEFGLYSIWPFFNDREVASEDALNTWEAAEKRHKVRVYPMKKGDGTVEPNAYVVATEEHTSGFDYQDVVYVIRNARPVAPDAPEIEAPRPDELVFSGTKTSTSAAQTVTVRNTGKGALEVSAEIEGTDAAAFGLVDTPAQTSVPAGGSVSYKVRFAPNGTVGPLQARLVLTTNDADEGTTRVGLYGLSTNGEQGTNEPPLKQVVDTLGHPINVGGTGLILGTGSQRIGDEVAAPYFRKAGAGNVTIKPVARYSPDEQLPFGWYATPASAGPGYNRVAAIEAGEEQTLNPAVAPGSADAFDPGDVAFGVYTDSANFGRKTHQTDSLNTAGPTRHAVRVYPAKNRSGDPMANAYLVTFEDASNGDYQDYVFLLTNVKPSDGTTPTTTTEKFNFQPEQVDSNGRAVATGGTPVAVPDGYKGDFGQAYDAASGHGWVQPNGTPADLSLNGRLRSAPADPLLRTLIIMQGKSSAGTVGTTASPVPVAWERAVANGTYTVKVGVGDAAFDDGTYGAKVEDVQVVLNFQPSIAGSDTHRSATAEVTVSDGKLTVLTTGTNTKLNFVEIIGSAQPEPDTTDPTVGVRVDGTKNAAGAYLKRATVTVDARDEAGGSDIESVTYSLDGGAVQPYDGPVAVTGEGDHTFVARATDNAGNEAVSEGQTFKVVIPPPGRGEIEVENADGVPFPDRLVFNRIQNPEDGSTAKRDDAGNITGYVPPNTVHDRSTLRIKNTGVDVLSVEELRVDDTSKFRINGQVDLPAVVKPGESLDVPVRFVYSSTSTTSSLQTGALTVVTDDTDEPETRMDLAGFWQPQSEGGKEPNFGQIVSTYGYGTTVPQGGSINTKGKLMAQGDEILSPYWFAADPVKPVAVRQLAAFHSQGATASFGWTQKGSYNVTNTLTHVGVDGQSLLPRKNDANRTPGLGTFVAPKNSSGQLVPFGFRSDPEHSDHAVNTDQGRAQIDYDQGCVEPCGHHFRIWPAMDRSGAIIPNAYLMTMDYAGINYDFQDNVYLVTNIKPENPALDPAAPAPLPGAPALNLEFDKSYANTLVDKNGVGTGFESTQPNKNDTSPGSDSYKKEFLETSIATPGTLALTTAGTTNGGATNGLVNGLRLDFDGSGGEYTIAGRLVGPLTNLGAGQGGVMFGSDQDNFVKVDAINKGTGNTPSIEFFAERGGNTSTANSNGTISTVAIPNGGNVASLDLYLIADKATGEVRAAYRADDGALAAMPGKVTLTSAQMGRFFAEGAKAGIIAHHGTSTNTPVQITFDRFAVTRGAPDPAATPRNALYRLDTGTARDFTYTDGGGNAWSSDAGLYTPSTAINEGNNTDAIDNTEDDALYRTYRGNVGNVPQSGRVLTYNLPTNGAEKLDLRLHFAERFHFEAGRRLFDIEVEGRKVRGTFDIFSAAGGKNSATALTLDDVAVTDGSLTLALRASLDYPAISGIEVLCEGACPDPDRTAPAAPTGLAATSSDAGMALDWDNNREADVAGYNVYRSATEGGAFAKLNSTLLAASRYDDAAAPAGATSFYKVEAVDASGNVSGASTASAARPQAVQAAVRINAGGSAQTVNGVGWRACDAATNCSGYVTGGGWYSENDTISGIPQGMNNAIFQSEWTGGRNSGIPAGGTAFSFNVPVQTGDYKLRLHFAELNKTANGARIFDVNVEGGAKELTSFDVFKEAGGTNKAIVREFPVTVSDGRLSVDFIAQVENAKASAIEILPVARIDSEVPAAPTGFAATASHAGIALDWADNAGADGVAGYNVYRSATEGGAFAKRNGAPLAGSTYNDVSVDTGKTYYYRVTAVDQTGNESGAASDSATMPGATGFSAITWTNAGQDQPYSNSEGQSEVVGGKMYTFGGFDSRKECCSPTARAYVFDLGSTNTNKWSRISNMPGQNGTPYGGVTHAGFTTDGEDIYWAGGYTANAVGNGQIFGTKEVWRYDVSDDSYSRLRDLPVERAGGQLEYLNGKLYYFGGTNLARTQDVGNLYVLDLSNQGAGWAEKAAMPNGRHHLASAVIGGQVYALGGQHGHDEVLAPQSDVHAYDPATDTWTQRAAMPKGLNHATSSTVVMGGRILTVGGQTNHGTGVADVNAYDPAADAWTSLTPLPVARHSGMAGVLDGGIYFTTGGARITYKGTPAADRTAPKVANVRPAENATGVRLDANVEASFDEAMDAGSLTAAVNFTLKKDGATDAVPAAVTYSGTRAILNPEADLEAGARYTATVRAEVKDAAGNQLGADKTWSFTALTAGDTEAPTVTGNSPGPQATDAPTDTTVRATFSEEMDASTVTGSTFFLTEQGGARVAATVEYDAAGKTATLTPGSALNASTTYMATVKNGPTGVKDAAGNALSADETWAFTTADTEAPTITETRPAPRATDVLASTNVTATFSEAMTASTINTGTFKLDRASDGSPATATVAYDAASKTATLDPGSDLAANTTYTATVTTGVQDGAGNPLASTVVWSFTTRAAPAQQPVRINDGGPAQNVGGVEWLGCSSVAACNGYVSGGFPYTRANAVSGVAAPANQALYQSEWTGGFKEPSGRVVPAGQSAFKFDVPVQNGSYKVRLHFAEIYQNAVGRRVFDVNIEGGTKELTSFDVFAEAGGINRAIVREFPATVSDGVLTVDFIRQVENAKVSAVEILPVATPSPAPATGSISLNASATTPTFGQATTLSGQLTAGGKALAGRKVVLEAKPYGANAYGPVPNGVLTTNTGGSFSLSGVTPAKHTDYRVRFAGDGAAQPATSAVSRVDVRVSVSNNTATTNLGLGGSRTISGMVAPNHVGKTVTVTVKKGTTTVATSSLALNSSSGYSTSFKPTSTGTYTVTASYAGDADNLGNTSPARSFGVV